MGSILCKNGRVWDGERFFLADVLTKDGKIAKIAPQIDAPVDFCYDAAGKTVTAGLVDAHVHFKKISSDDFGICADTGTLPFGVTAAADASGCQGDRQVLDSFTVKNGVFVCAEIKNNQAFFDVALHMAEQYRDKVMGVKVYFDTAASQVSDETPLCQTVEFAKKQGFRVMVHSTGSPISMERLLSCLSPGDILTHAYHGGAHTVKEDGFASLLAAKQRGVIIDAGLAGQVHTDFEVFRSAIEADAIPDVISTDITCRSAYRRGGLYGLPLCMSIARHLGMKEEDVFRAVTSAPAKALGKAEEWGSLAVGRAADLAVLESADSGFSFTDRQGNSVQSSTGYRNCLTVLDGDIVYRRD